MPFRQRPSSPDLLDVIHNVRPRLLLQCFLGRREVLADDFALRDALDPRHHLLKLVGVDDVPGDANAGRDRRRRRRVEGKDGDPRNRASDIGRVRERVLGGAWADNGDDVRLRVPVEDASGASHPCEEAARVDTNDLHLAV